MGETPVLSGELVQFDGIFDFKELYKHMYGWLDWNKYPVSEKRYTEKSKATGKDIELEWEAEKELDDYSKIVFFIKINAFKLDKVEVQKDGAKVKMDKGLVEASVSVTLMTDYENRWEKNPVLKFLKSFFEKYLYGGQIFNYKILAWKEGWGFVNEAKAFLNLYRY